MRYNLFLFMILTFLFISCNDKECSYDTDCESPKICDNNKCFLASKDCEKDSDCTTNGNRCGDGNPCKCDKGSNVCVGYNPCKPNNCIDKNRTICNPTINSENGFYECLCNTTFHLENEKCIQTCKDNTCNNNGECSINENGLTKCSCNTGYTGDFCNECALNYQDNDNNKTCELSCTLAKRVLKCEEKNKICSDKTGEAICITNIDECENNPCLNGGICIDGEEDYTCNCLDDYKGKNCEIKINGCDSDPCLNGGICTNTESSYICNCENTGFEGTNCENNINECENNPCLNGGTCTDGVNSFTCTCIEHFLGERCETCEGGYHLNNNDICIPNEGCDGNTCNGHGICTVNEGIAICDCLPSYTGTYCNECNTENG